MIEVLRTKPVAIRASTATAEVPMELRLPQVPHASSGSHSLHRFVEVCNACLSLSFQKKQRLYCRPWSRWTPLAHQSSAPVVQASGTPTVACASVVYPRARAPPSRMVLPKAQTGDTWAITTRYRFVAFSPPGSLTSVWWEPPRWFELGKWHAVNGHVSNFIMKSVSAIPSRIWDRHYAERDWECLEAVTAEEKEGQDEISGGMRHPFIDMRRAPFQSLGQWFVVLSMKTLGSALLS
jgi:hypothetical protein